MRISSRLEDSGHDSRNAQTHVSWTRKTSPAPVCLNARHTGDSRRIAGAEAEVAAQRPSLLCLPHKAGQFRHRARKGSPLTGRTDRRTRRGVPRHRRSLVGQRVRIHHAPRQPLARMYMARPLPTNALVVVAAMADDLRFLWLFDQRCVARCFLAHKSTPPSDPEPIVYLHIGCSCATGRRMSDSGGGRESR